jgi:ribonuclease P/MRP protein subunit POP5
MVRFKFRYFLCEIDSEELIEASPGIVLQKIKDAVLKNFGVIGLSKITTSISLKYLNPKLGVFIVRVSREHQAILHNALTFI